MKCLALTIVCLAAFGCVPDGRTTGASLEDSIQPQQAKMLALAPSTAQVIQRQPLVALPAEAGVVASVRSRDYINGVRQDIVLKSGAVHGIENGIAVIVRTSRQPTLDESVPLAKPTEAAIRSEIGAQFPRINMQIVDREASNAYGPYGLALGRAPGNAHCLYMWQWVDENRLPQGGGLSGPASIRVRLCLGNTNFDAMATMVDHLLIGPAASTSAPVQAAADDTARVIVAGAEPTTETVAPERKAVHPRPKAHKRKKDVAAREQIDEAGADDHIHAPSAATVMSAAPVAQPLPNDLPPQAYSGPKANAH